MLTREQVYTMLLLRKRESTIFATLPSELIREVSDCDQDPNSDIAKALHHAAYARKEDVEALLALLDGDPTLLLQAGNVLTPGGDEWRRVTIYEFLLGAGDFELTQKVQCYFAKIEHGEREKKHQYERYKPHIEGMITQKPYDLSPLIEVIKKATVDQVTALLYKDMTGNNELCNALRQFRKDWAPKVLTKPCMHYNYASLQHAFATLEREWDNLYRESNNSYTKILLVWRLLIGFEMRRLPGIDRCMMAQGMHFVINQQENVTRSYKFRNNDSDFPACATDWPDDGLGVDFAVSIYGACERSVGALTGRGYAHWTSILIGSLISKKTVNLQSLCNHTQFVPTKISLSTT